MILFHAAQIVKQTERMGREHFNRLDSFFSCNGGDHHSAFQYFADQGLVTGGSFGSKIGCKPYPINPDRNVDKPASTKCQKSCQPSYDKRNYLADKTRGGSQVYLSRNNKAVMNEIIDRGPVVAEFALYDDFLSYKVEFINTQLESFTVIIMREFWVGVETKKQVVFAKEPGAKNWSQFVTSKKNQRMFGIKMVPSFYRQFFC
jgi:hypothetical protein